MQGSNKGILEEALKLLEDKITINCAAMPLRIEISSQQERAIFRQEVPLDELQSFEGYKILSEAMDVIAGGINRYGYLTSVLLEKPQGASFSEVLSGKKAHLRMVVLYNILSDRFIALFDCMVAQPVAVEVAA